MQSLKGIIGGLAGGIFLIGLAIAFYLSSRFSGDWFLPVLFVTLGFTSLIGSISSLKPSGIYGGIQGFVFFVGLAILFLPGVSFWPWILVVLGISAILGSLAKPIITALFGVGILAATTGTRSNPQPQQYYDQPHQPYQQGYQPMQPPPAPGTYQEGGQQHQYPQQGQPKQQYDVPETQYPQEMPPQQ